MDIGKAMMYNPILVYDGSREEFDSLPVREQCSHYSIHIARSIELLLEVMNKHEDDTAVEGDLAMITEPEIHEHIAKYMRLSESFAGEKPAGESKNDNQ